MAIDPNDPDIDDDVKYWLGQIEGALNAKDCKRWHTTGQKVQDRYFDEFAAIESSQVNNAAAHTMNVLWSNVETIKPALYAKTPNPKVQRRYRDKDPVGRWGAIVLERSLGYTLDAYDVDYAIRNCVEDYLLPGRGQVWVSYEPTISKNASGVETLDWEYCKTEHVKWKDFLTNPARTWDEVWWVAKRAYLSKKEVKANQKFVKGIEKKLSFTETKDEGKSTDNTGERVKKAPIWCIWCKTDGTVYYVSSGCPELLAKPAPPPISFEGFFPCPRPLTATTTTKSIIPRPDFLFYQNQADEIDRLTQRINLLTKALRVVGLYDASQESLQNILADSTDNVMIPVANWAVFAQQNGLDGSTSFFPLDVIVKALNECYAARDQAKAVMYEITGISDIVRGASDPNETLGAQQIKTQWGALRIRDRQTEVQRFVRDVLRLKSEIIAEHFQLETLKTMSNAPLLMAQEKQQLQQRKQFAQQAQAMSAQNPQMAQQIAQANPQLAQMAQPLTLDEEQRLREPTWEEVFALLRDQKLRSFRIDIETDSTIQADETEEKASRTEFIAAMTTFITAWGPIIQAQPKMAPLAGEMLTFGARAFKASVSLESEIENMTDMLSQQALTPPKPPPPDPKVVAKQKSDSDKLALADKHHEADLAFEQQKHADEMNFKVQQHNDTMGLKQNELSTNAEKEVNIAKAGQPQMPPPEEVQAAMGPMFQIMQQMTAQMMEAAVAIQAQTAQAVEASQQRIEQSIAQMMQIAASPKQITVHRDARGQIAGGTATPRRPN